MGTFFGLEHYVVCIGRGSHGEITAECSREEGGKLESAIQVPSNKKTECFLDALSPKDRLRLLYRVYEECEDASLWMDRFALLDSATDKQLVSQTEKDIRRANEDFAATPAGEDHKSFFEPITEDIRRLYARGLYEKVVELGVHCLCLFMNQMEWFQFDVADGSEKIRDFTLKAFERANLSHAERLVYEARLYHSTRSYWYFSTNKKTLWPHPKKVFEGHVGRGGELASTDHSQAERSATSAPAWDSLYRLSECRTRRSNHLSPDRIYQSNACLWRSY